MALNMLAMPNLATPTVPAVQALCTPFPPGTTLSCTTHTLHYMVTFPCASYILNYMPNTMDCMPKLRILDTVQGTLQNSHFALHIAH